MTSEQDEEGHDDSMNTMDPLAGKVPEYDPYPADAQNISNAY